MATSATTITLGEVRLSYCNLFQPRAQQPGSDPKYSVTVLVPKSNTQAKALMDAAVAAAIDQGVSKCWNGVRPPMPAICVHDGDGTRPSDGQPFGDECKGHWVFTASCKADRPPFVVDANVQPILQQAEVYSGMYGRVNVTFFAYANSGKKGIGCGLNGVQKIRDGEPLGGGRITAEEAFTPVSTQPEAPVGYGYAPSQPTASAGYGYAPAPAQPAAPTVPGFGIPSGTNIMGM